MGKSTLRSVRQAAEELGFTAQYIYKLIEDGKIEAERVGGYWMIEKSEVDRYKGISERSGKNEAVSAKNSR